MNHSGRLPHEPVTAPPRHIPTFLVPGSAFTIVVKRDIGPGVTLDPLKWFRVEEEVKKTVRDLVEAYDDLTTDARHTEQLFVYTGKARYPASVHRVNEALRKIAEKYGLRSVEWHFGDVHEPRSA